MSFPLDNRWSQLKDHDPIIKEQRQLMDMDYYHDDEIDYEMLERVDPLVNESSKA